MTGCGFPSHIENFRPFGISDVGKGSGTAAFGYRMGGRPLYTRAISHSANKCKTYH